MCLLVLSLDPAYAAAADLFSWRSANFQSTDSVYSQDKIIRKHELFLLAWSFICYFAIVKSFSAGLGLYLQHICEVRVFFP